ncbi:MAG: tetratricopeptide repeat protein [Gammaproteobacteria bacterium]
MAIAYAVTAWLLLQLGAIVFPTLHAPSWCEGVLLAFLVIGFPVAVLLAWAFEVTPEGVRHTEAADSEATRPVQTHRRVGRTLNIVIIAILAAAVGVLAWQLSIKSRPGAAVAIAPVKSVTAPTTTSPIPVKSIAVLPFANESGAKDQQYFSDGLSEELISDLTQIDGLKVIGKYSSFQFRDSKDSTAQIGRVLGVANLIQGSVFQQGGRIRVIVSMIRTNDGSNLWSHSYDKKLQDVFAIQSQISQAVAAALKIKLMGQAIVSDDKPPNGNIEAYKLMLQGRTLTRRLTEAHLRQGIALLQQALKLDPNYAYAWGTLSNAWVILGSYFLSGDARHQAYSQARMAANKQQTLAPDAAYTHMDRGYLLATVDGDALGALTEYRQAYALTPNDGTVINFLAGGLETVGQLQAAVELYRKAIATDPLRAGFYINLGYTLLGQRRLDAAEQAFNKALGLQPDFPGLYAYLAQVAILRGDATAALRDANRETDPMLGSWIRALAKQIGPDHQQADAALQGYLAKNSKTQPYLVADLYALRKQPDPMFAWLKLAWKQHDPNLTASLLSDPFVLAYQHDPRFAAFRIKIGLSAPGTVPAAATANSKNTQHAESRQDTSARSVPPYRFAPRIGKKPFGP